MKKSHTLLINIYILLLLTACSTTKNLPEDEQLYIGIKEITYNNSEALAAAAERVSKDSAGVITAVSNAVTAIRDAFEGKSTDGLDYEHINPKEMTKKERKLYREKLERDKEAYTNAVTEVDAVLAYPPNYSLMGSSSLRSPFKPGLWIYNSFVNDSTKFGRWMFKHFSTQPVFISNVAPDTRTKVATNTLHNYGYFHGKVDYEVLPQRNPRKAKMAYHVTTGPLFRLDSIERIGFPIMTDSLLKARQKESLLKKDDAFSVVNLTGEQQRISQLLRQNGYYFFSPTYITFLADTVQRPGFVQLRVKPTDALPERASHPWYIGDIHLNLTDNKGVHHFTLPRLTPRRRTGRFARVMGGETVKPRPLTEAELKQARELPVKPILIDHSIFHRYGRLYRLRGEELSIEKLNSLGIFSQMDLSYVPRAIENDTLGTFDNASARCDTLDVWLNATMDKLYDSSLEMNATMKSNQQLGPGLTYSLAKRNAFRGGEKVAFKIFGSYEWQTGGGTGTGNSLLNSYELGTSLSFEFPRFVLPFISQRRFDFPATTTFSLEGDWRNRAGFFQMVSMALVADYSWHKRRTVNHDVQLKFDFNRMLTTTTAFDSIMKANPVIETTMRNNFIPSLGYTFTYKSSPRRHNPIWVQFSVKEAGNVTSLLYAAAGQSLNSRGKRFCGNQFAQFLKATGEVHWSHAFNERFTLAVRGFTGVIVSYGNSLIAPYSEQFYVGGANSLRGFTVRSVGPGRYRSPDTRYSYIDQTGDLKLEANAELRAHLFGNLSGALFLDAGNVWNLREHKGYDYATLSDFRANDIAVNTGLGLRYDLDFLVLRFDLGVPLHAPYDTGKTGWYNIPKFWKGLAFHFAIGYPF